jgi:hypothetical protein
VPNATKLQAVAAVIAATATGIAVYFAGTAYRSTLAQLELTKKQLVLAEEQFRTEAKRLEEERSSKRRAARSLWTSSMRSRIFN